MKRLSIADVRIGIDYLSRDFFDRRFAKYEDNSDTEPDLTISTHLKKEIDIPPGKIVEQIGYTTVIQVDYNIFCRYTWGKTGRIQNATFFNDSHTHVDIHLANPGKASGFTLTEYEYLLTGLAFNDRLAKLGGAVLHGSAIAYAGQGIIFSANSGVGKSTHTRLWMQRFGSKAVIINDDKPAIRFYDCKPCIFGTPWSGKTDLSTNTRAPLKAIVFIKRAEINRIECLSPRESIVLLSGQIWRPYYDNDICLMVMDFIDKLVRSVPIFRLHCNISQDAVSTVFDRLSKDEAGGLCAL